MESIVINRALEYKKKLKVDSEIPRNITKGYNWFLLNTETPKEDVWGVDKHKVVSLEVKDLWQEVRIGFDSFNGIRIMNVTPLLFNRICNSLYDTYGSNIPLWCGVIICRYDRCSEIKEKQIRADGKKFQGRVRYVLATPKEYEFKNLISKYNKKKDFTEINAWLK